MDTMTTGRSQTCVTEPAEARSNNLRPTIPGPAIGEDLTGHHDATAGRRHQSTREPSRQHPDRVVRDAARARTSAAIAVTALAVNERIVAMAAAVLCVTGMALVLHRDERLSWHDGLLDLAFLLAFTIAASIGYAGGVQWRRTRPKHLPAETTGV